MKNAAGVVNYFLFNKSLFYPLPAPAPIPQGAILLRLATNGASTQVSCACWGGAGRGMRSVQRTQAQARQTGRPRGNKFCRAGQGESVCAPRGPRPQGTADARHGHSTLYAVGEWENAIAAFQKRIDMGGWYEEVFQSMLDQGRALVRLGRDPTPRLRAAFEYCPWRAEPLYELAMWHDDQANKCEGGPPFPEACRMSHRAAGYAVAKVAAALPRPDRDGLFVWGQMYDYQASLQKAVHAYYLAEGAIGVLEDGVATNAALAARFPGKPPYAANAPLFEGLVRRFYANAPGRVPPGAAA